MYEASALGLAGGATVEVLVTISQDSATLTSTAGTIELSTTLTAAAGLPEVVAPAEHHLSGG